MTRAHVYARVWVWFVAFTYSIRDAINILSDDGQSKSFQKVWQSIMIEEICRKVREREKCNYSLMKKRETFWYHFFISRREHSSSWSKFVFLLVMGYPWVKKQQLQSVSRILNYEKNITIFGSILTSFELNVIFFEAPGVVKQICWSPNQATISKFNQVELVKNWNALTLCSIVYHNQEREIKNVKISNFCFTWSLFDHINRVIVVTKRLLH